MEKDVKELLKKYNAGTCTDREKALVESWYAQWRGEERDMSWEERELIKSDVWSKISKSHLKKRYGQPRLPYLLAAAAVAVLFFAVGLVFYLNQPHHKGDNIPHMAVAQSDVQPGSNKAVLTLADGTTVTLDEAANGEITEVAGMTIKKTADGQLVYEVEAANAQLSSNPNTTKRYNQISTPRGGQYQIILPDGTRVWLNSASSLKYPLQFTAGERRVELKGEAYFEVSRKNTAAGKLIPFFVETTSQVIEVLGTHFNVSSYDDEESTKTTLLEGSVRVSMSATDNEGKTFNQTLILKPNQQSILTKGRLDAIPVDATESIAWRDGYFNFNDANLETVMRELSRWYDVDVVYEGNVPKGTYTGKVYRNMSLSKVFDILTYAEVKFKITGKTIVIYP